MAIRHEISGYKDNLFVGVYDIIEWVPTAWVGPDKPGIYLTADGKGNTTLLHTTGDTDRMKEVLFERFEGIYWDDSTRLTDSEIVKLAFCGFQVWYTFESDYSYGEYNGEDLVIFRKESEPKYWLRGGKLTGPIDDELAKSPIHRTDFTQRRSYNRYGENHHDTFDDIPLF